MNRIGNRIITFNEKINVTIKDNFVTVKGPKGTLSRQFSNLINIKCQDNQITTSMVNHSRHAKAMLGTINSHLFNMVNGVEKGFKKQLVIVGVGYRAAIKNGKLSLLLGFSHPVELTIPTDIKVTITRNTIVLVEGIDKEKVGQFAALIRSHRKPEPYLGKGIKYDGEKIIRKAGKTINK